MDSLNPDYLINARLRASHLAERHFPSACISFAQKNVTLYREMLTLDLGLYYF